MGQRGVKRVLGNRDYTTIAAMAAAGHRLEDIARRLDMDTRTLREIRARDERAVEAFEAGRGELHTELVSKLLEHAKNGRTAELIFALKSIFGYSDRPAPQQHEHFHRVQIQLPAALDRERYARELRSDAPPALQAPVVDAEIIEPAPEPRKRLRIKRKRRKGRSPRR